MLILFRSSLHAPRSVAELALRQRLATMFTFRHYVLNIERAGLPDFSDRGGVFEAKSLRSALHQRGTGHQTGHSERLEL